MQMPQKENNRIFCRWKIPLVIAAGIAALLFWGDVFREILKVLFGAAVIAFFLTPAAALAERRFSRPLSAFLALMAALSLLFFAAALLLPALLRQVMLLADVLPEALGRISDILQEIGSWLQRQMPGIPLPKINPAALGTGIGEAARGAVSTVGSLAGGLYRCFLMLVLSFFLISDRERILLCLELAVPLKWRRAAVRSGSQLVRQLRLYLRGQLTIALAVGLLAVLAMRILKLQGSLVLGLTVGACNVIPYFGPFIGGIPAVITALGISWQRAIWTAAALFLVQQIDGLLISPRVMGGVTGFSPAVVLIALFAGARIGGVGAMLLTLPVLMAIRTAYRVFVQLHEKN